jgi:hypothetical protein
VASDIWARTTDMPGDAGPRLGRFVVLGAPDSTSTTTLRATIGRSGASPHQKKVRSLVSPTSIACYALRFALLFLKELASIYLSFLRKCGLLLANGIGSVICLGTASVIAGLMYGEDSTPRVFLLLLLILVFLLAGFYLFIRCLKVISPKRRIPDYPWHVHHDERK